MAVLSGEALVIMVVLTLTPGADTILTLRQSLTGGLRRAVPTIAGINVGTPIHASVAGFGLAAILARSPAAFRTIQWAGVAYLAYLGVRSLLAAWRPAQVVDISPVADGRAGWAAFRDGLATNLLNPKVALFYLGFLPQFIPAGPAFAWTAVLYGLVHCLMGEVQLSTVAILADRVRGRLTDPKFRTATEAVAGTVLLMFAVRLALA